MGRAETETSNCRQAQGAEAEAKSETGVDTCAQSIATAFVFQFNGLDGDVARRSR